MDIKNLKKASERILKALKDKERIILYGDSDMDGMASVIILKEAIKNIGKSDFSPIVYFPDREVEGYGISEIALDYLKKFSPALLITLDCGISNFKEVNLAKKMGFEVVIIDHHQVPDKLPKASIIVDPKQKGDKSSFKDFAAAGIVLKLALLLLKDRQAENLEQGFYELAALATLADMMPKEGENQKIINQGFISLQKSWRPGLGLFFENKKIQEIDTLNNKISKIISILNVRDVEDRLPIAFRLLTNSSLEDGKKIIEKLFEKAKFRKEKIGFIVDEVNQRIFEKKEEKIIFEGDGDWDFSLISSAASIICRERQKPVFIYKILEKESQGTVRVPKGINSVTLMEKCSKNLLTFGGHPLASGFRLKNNNLEKFKKCLIANLKK